MAYYAIWWVPEADLGARMFRTATSGAARFSASWSLGAQEIKYTVMIGFALAIAVILIARLFDRGAKAEG